jgi:uncharacterized protein YecE (DUF72 family)
VAAAKIAALFRRRGEQPFGAKELSMSASFQRESPGNHSDPRRTTATPRAHGRGVIPIGISGWRYPPWRGGAFYPKGLAQRRELEYASRVLASVEINGSFYSLQRPESYTDWRDETPDDFVFSVKGGRYIPHMLRLRNVEKEPRDARRISPKRAGQMSARDVYCYFDNTDKVEALANALLLMQKLGVAWEAEPRLKRRA